MIKNWNPIEENRKLKRRKNWMLFILLSLFIIFIFAIYPNTQVRPPSSSLNQGEESSPASASSSLPEGLTYEEFKRIVEEPIPPDRQIRYWRELAEALAEQNKKQETARAWEYEALRAEQQRMKMEMELRIIDAETGMRNQLSKERYSSGPLLDDPLLESKMRNVIREQESMKGRYESDMRRMRRELHDLEDKANYRRRRD